MSFYCVLFLIIQISKKVILFHSFPCLSSQFLTVTPCNKLKKKKKKVSDHVNQLSINTFYINYNIKIKFIPIKIFVLLYNKVSKFDKKIK